MKKTVAVVYGGASPEHEISIITGVTALNALPSCYKAVPLYLKGGKFYSGKSLFDIRQYSQFSEKSAAECAVIGDRIYIKKRRGKLVPFDKIDVALLATHGGEGENGSLAGFFEINNIPYTQGSPYSAAVTLDKEATKIIAEKCGVKVVEWLSFCETKTGEYFNEAESKLGYPLVVKPNDQGSSIGVTLVKTHCELKDAAELALQLSQKLIIERAIPSPVELNIAVMRNGGDFLVSEPERPLLAKEILSFKDKYEGGTIIGGADKVREFPANVSEEVAVLIKETALKMYKFLDLNGVVRFDYLLENGGLSEETLYLNEINSIPGSLSRYLFPQLSNAEFYEILINNAGTQPKFKPFESGVLKNIVGAKCCRKR
ncbi:MAG: ATP-grasp domain-containing protein [Christensenellaceae bacterium]|jgi:D-alanine-D-alanine ligase|nr:ATP-grasp domain-containing protein [Christensenellaceae bacterium]